MERPNILLARHLRQRSTDAENKLWQRLRNRQLHGIKFRRQLPIGPFIADFAAASIHLVIELDGGQHNDRSEEDGLRTMFMESCGYTVLRYWNHDVMQRFDDVLSDILQQLVLAAPHPDPLPGGERETIEQQGEIHAHQTL